MLNIDNILSDKNAVYIIRKNGEVKVEHNIFKPFRSASVIKIFILAYYLEHGEKADDLIVINETDRIDFSDVKELSLASATVYELMTLMIGSSDNTATNLLINYAGMEALNEFIRERFNAVGTVVGRVMLDYEAQKEGRDNFTCLADVVKCLDFCLEFESGRKILASQKCRDRTLRYIYKDVSFYGKAGEIPGVFNDVAYIDGNFVGVLTDGMDNDSAAVLCGKAGLITMGSERPVI